MTELFKKYHTWLIALVSFVIVAFQYITGTVVPEVVYGLLAAVGLGSARFTMAQVLGVTGWKTYVVAIGLGLIAGARSFGIPIPQAVDDFIITVAGGSLASAAKKAS